MVLMLLFIVYFQMSVLIKSNPECASSRYILYEATAEQLASTFIDGQTKYGRSHSVKLEEVDVGKHVEIFIKYIDTRIVIRLVGGYLTFSIKIPEEFLNSSSSGLALCTKGCPKNELINYKQFLAEKSRESVISAGESVNMTRDKALKLCRQSNLVDFYLDSCVFDLLTTGNETFKHAAYAALEDVLKFDPNYSKSRENRTTLDVYDKLVSSNSAVRTSGYFSSCSVLVLVLVTLTFMNAMTTLNSS